MDERTARFTASTLPSGQFLEVRILWPAGMVSGIASTFYSLESIKEEEVGFLRGIIEKARRAQGDARNARSRVLKSERGLIMKATTSAYLLNIVLILSPLILGVLIAAINKDAINNTEPFSRQVSRVWS